MSSLLIPIELNAGDAPMGTDNNSASVNFIIERAALRVPRDTWSPLSYTAGNTRESLRLVAERLGIPVLPRLTKEELANLLIANGVPYPDAMEDKAAWAASVQSIQPIAPNSAGPRLPRSAADEAMAKQLQQQLNDTKDELEVDSDSELQDIEVVQQSGKRGPDGEIKGQPKTKRLRIDSAAIGRITDQLKSQQQQMQKEMEERLEQVVRRTVSALRNDSASSAAVPPSCRIIACTEKFAYGDQFCKYHGALELHAPKTNQTQMVKDNVLKGVVQTGNATTTWNQHEAAPVDSNNHNHGASISSAAGNPITLNLYNNIEPNLSFAQVHAILPEKVIQDARKGKWVPLARFLPSQTAMVLRELENSLSENELAIHKVAQILKEASNSNSAKDSQKQPSQTISSAYQILQAFAGGLIPAACEENWERLQDYQLFLLQIVSLMQQQQWQYVLAYVEEVRKSKQTLESHWKTHRLAATNDTGVHQDVWALTIARQFAKQNPQQNNNTSRTANALASAADGEQERCKNFASKGKCRFGDKCRYLHENAASSSNNNSNSSTRGAKPQRREPKEAASIASEDIQPIKPEMN